jgi:anti-sigma factor RsiW
MTEFTCRYPGDREQAIVAYVYDDGDLDRAARALFEAHLTTCDRCRIDVAAFADVRVTLGAWSPPGFRPAVASALDTLTAAPAPDRRQSWRDIPLWAQTAAALLCLGIGAGIANLDVHYDASGLRIRTGWSTPASAAAATGPAEALRRPAPNAVNEPAGAGNTAAPWRAELAALEQRLRTDLGQASVGAPSDTGAAELRRVRTLLDESERRQQRELALRLAEAMREVKAQRQEDLVRIDRNIGAMQSNTGREMLRQRSEMLNYVAVRTASQRGQ